MAVTAYKFPTAYGDLYDEGWANPTYLYTDDSNGARAYPPLKTNYTTFGFTSGDIPEGATIDGIEVEVEAFSTVNPSTANFFAQLTIDSGGFPTLVGDVKSVQFVYASEKKQWGGAADTWGRSWTQAEIVDAQFGINLYAESVSGPSTQVRADYVSIRVYYTTLISLELTETVVASDTKYVDITLYKTETVTATDTILSDLTVEKTESVTVADTPLQDITLELTESVEVKVKDLRKDKYQGGVGGEPPGTEKVIGPQVYSEEKPITKKGKDFKEVP